MKRFLIGLFLLTMTLTVPSAFGADVSVHQWVRPDTNGHVVGRVIIPRDSAISALRDANVLLLDESGNRSASLVKSDSTGRFALMNVQPGAYTLLIRGDNAMACCALHIVSRNVPLDSTFEIAAGAIDYSTVQGVMMRYSSLDGGSSPIIFDPTMNPWSTDRASKLDSLRIVQTEGGFHGRITKAGFTEKMGASLANVFVYQEGMEVARTTTDENGDFRVKQLAPGSYTVIGIGKDGFGLMGLDLIAPLETKTVQDRSNSVRSLVSMQAELSSSFIMQMAPIGGAVTLLNDQTVSADPSAISIDATPGNVVDSGYGMMGGGGGGGGAIGAGGGNWGALGFIGAAIAIALSDDDDVIVVPGPVSPSTP